MQVVLITRNLLESITCTEPMLLELLTSTLGYSEEAAGRIMAEQLAKPGKAYKDLPHNKARTILIQKLSQHEHHSADFNAGRLRVALNCLATPEEPKAQQQAQGEQKARTGNMGARKTDLTGPYWVAKRKDPQDAGKDLIWDHMWACSSFEEFFKAAPAKGVTKTGRVISAYSEIAYAVKCGWLVRGVKPQAEQAEQQQAA